jgi:antitoxin component YwqK of YwqJK toxin-antitoxin module
MKLSFLTAIFIFQFTLLYSQKADTTYFNKDWQETIKDSAMYYRIGKRDFGVSEGMITDYYMSGKVQMKGGYFNFSRHGEFTWYYENGNKKEEGIYDYDKYRILNSWNEQGKKIVKNGTGLNIWYYEIGVKKSETQYKFGLAEGKCFLWERNGKLYEEDNCEAGDCKVVTFWDKAGNKEITDGTGKYVLYYSTGIEEVAGWHLNGKMTGRWTWYYENGKERAIGVYDLNGMRIGE